MEGEFTHRPQRLSTDWHPGFTLLEDQFLASCGDEDILRGKGNDLVDI